MRKSRRGCGVLFYDKARRRVLFFRRDSKPTIPFPDYIDILGGHVEDGETSEHGVAREIAEELEDLRSGCPFTLAGHRVFKVYTDEWGVEQHVFSKEADFDLSDVHLKEGQALIWLTEEEAGRTLFAFDFSGVVAEFFGALGQGRV